jgi:hypothetical protein
MQILDERKRNRRSRFLGFLALAWLGSAFAQSSLQKAPALVDLGPLPPGWISNQEVMDEHWRPLMLKGVNYFAFGGPAPPNHFAARSDPRSNLYQAWFGCYAVQGGRELFAHADRAAQFQWLSKLAEYDQVAWLVAMGDPKPDAKWIEHSKPMSISIDGKPRILYEATMVSHSDLSRIGPDSTPLAKSIGMPEVMTPPDAVQPFHPITLRGLYSFWYDPVSDRTFVAYGVSSSFTDANGSTHDNSQSLASTLRKLLEGIKIPAASK